MAKLKFLSDFWRKKSFLFGIIVFFLLLVGVSYVLFNSSKKTPFVTYPAEGNYVHGEVIVAFREGYVPKELEEEIKNKQSKNNVYGLTRILKNEKTPEDKLKLIKTSLDEIGIKDYKPEFDGDTKELNKLYILYYDSKTPLEEIQERLKKLDFLESSEPNSILTIDTTPNDPLFSQLWGMQKIQAPQAWDITTGSDAIVVADIDTGVDLSHPDLSTSLVPGWNFINNTNNPQDDHGHGTHVAGTIGGIGNNSVGVAGVNWRIKIMPIKTMDNTGSGTSAVIMQGIKYAADNGAKVANLSLGGSGSCSSSQQTTINYAISKGTTVIIAAGNSGIDSINHQPGNCNGVITVGATDNQDKRSIWTSGNSSNYGQIVEIGAPGTGIVSTYRGGGYRSQNGTSMATPHVAGAAALLLSANPSLSPQQVATCLINNADPISTDRPIGPRLNIFRAISACAGGNVPTLPPASNTPTPSPSPTTNPTRVPSPTPTSTPATSPSPPSSPLNVTVQGRFVDQNGTTLTSNIGQNIRIIDSNNVIYLHTQDNSTWYRNNLAPRTYTVTGSTSQNYRVSVSSCVNCTIHSASSYVNPANNSSSITVSLPTGGNYADIYFKFTPITSSTVLTPTPTSTPAPTSTPIPTSTPVPIPTIQTTYNCQIDPACKKGLKNLQLCPLICVPN